MEACELGFTLKLQHHQVMPMDVTPNKEGQIVALPLASFVCYFHTYATRWQAETKNVLGGPAAEAHRREKPFVPIRSYSVLSSISNHLPFRRVSYSTSLLASVTVSNGVAKCSIHEGPVLGSALLLR